MKKAHIGVLAVVIAMSLTTANVLEVSGGGTATRSRPQRFSPPVNGRAGYVNTSQYFLMPDPKAASRVLLEEAQLAQVDINQSGRPSGRREINVASGTFEPRIADQFLTGNAAAHGDTVCLIKLSRIPSIRELANIMSIGVRPLKGIPHSTYIARVPFNALVQLHQDELVEWIGVYDPAYKIPKTEFPSGQPVSVYSLAGDQEEFRRDLERTGAIVREYHESISTEFASYVYTIDIDPQLLPEIAQFWWVERFAPNFEFRTRAFAAQPTAATFNGHFRPMDSRRLVSDLNQAIYPGAIYEGDGVTALVYDNGCYHHHQALTGRVLSGLSDVSTDSFHGTHVSGILLGEYAKYVDGGGVAGVAPKAHFALKTINTHSLTSALSTPGISIANHSWAVGQGTRFEYAQASSDIDLFAYDQHDVLSITVAGYINTNIEAPGTAKNALTVGSIYYVPADTAGFDVLGMKEFYSGEGPTRDDSRLKPDLVAPGGSIRYGVVSCKSPTLITDASTWDIGYGGYASYWGTSIAAPHVSGVAAVVAESYVDYIVSNGLQSNANYAPTSQLYRAMLVNTAIPLRWNGNSTGSFPASPGDTVATSETRRAFANGEYGYGLVNGYSGVLSSSDEYRRPLIWQDTVALGDSTERTFSVRDSPFGAPTRPRYLVGTMAYDDIPAPGGDLSPMRDRLEFALVAPDGTVHRFARATGVTTGTVEKIIIPWPRIDFGGLWKARILFPSTADTRPLPRQSFAVVVDVMQEAPRLSVQGPKSSYEIKTGSTTPLKIPVTIRNVGGNVAAGVTVRLDDPQHRLPFGSAVDTTFYVGNLLKSGEVVQKVLEIRAPAYALTIPLELKVDLINKLADGGPYPMRTKITINAVDKVSIKGKLIVLPGGTDSVEDAEILVDGVPWHTKTGADGRYEVEVPKNSVVKIKPRKGTSIFLPADTTYTNVQDDKQNQNFKARYHMVDGRVRDENGLPLQGVLVEPRTSSRTKFKATADSTDSLGRFEAYVEHCWTGQYVPRSNDEYITYALESASHTYFDSVVTNLSDLNFRAHRAALWGGKGMQVSTSIAGDYAPRCVGDGAGGALVFWADPFTNVRAQLIDAAGVKQWDNDREMFCLAAGEQTDIRGVRLNDASFVLAWLDRRNGNWDIYAQRLAATGEPLWMPNGIPICQAPGDQTDLTLEGTGDHAIAVWSDRRSGNSDIYAQCTNGSGELLWGSNALLVCGEQNDQRVPAAAVASDGSVYFAWQDKRPGTSGLSDTYVQRVSSAGTPLLAANGVLVSGDGASTVLEEHQQIRASTDGACFLAYRTNSTFLMKIGPAGNLQWPTWKTIPGEVELCADMSGGVTVTAVHQVFLGGSTECGGYSKPVGLVRHYDSTGENTWGNDATTGLARVASTSVAAVPDGGVIVVWQVLEGCTSNGDLIAQRYDASGTPLWGTGFQLAIA